MTRFLLIGPLPSVCLPTAFGARRRKQAAFTLIETALALGIVAFALVPIIGILPIGLQVSRTATDLTISAQIAQRLTSMIQQDSVSAKGADSISEFDKLKEGGPSGSDLEQKYFYFDGSGQPIPPTGTSKSVPVYAACILAPKLPPTPMPDPPSVSDSTSAITLVIQVVNDPGQQLKGKPPMRTLPNLLQTRSVTIPVYLANNGN